MKKIINYISTLCVVLSLGACQKDLEVVTYDPANATAAVVDAIDESYVLTADQSNDLAIKFTWSEPDFGFSASSVNKLEMDIKGEEFASKRVIASVGRGGEFSFTHKELNSEILSLLDSYAMELGALDLEFRLRSSISDSSEPLYSNVVSANVTPFKGEKQYAGIAVIGTYSGWNFGNSQKLYSPEADGIYYGLIAFNGQAQDGWKISEADGWKGGNWGSVDNSETPEQSPITLFNDGGSKDMKHYSKEYYRFKFDTSNCELTVEASYDVWGLVGQFSGWADGADAPMTLASEVDESGVTQFYLTAEVDLVAGEGWKLRPDGTWGSDLGPGAFAGGEPSSKDGNFYVEEDGHYAIRWYFNKVEQVLMAIKLASATPAVLEDVEPSYTFEEDTAADNNFTLGWSAADLGTTMPISYDVEVDFAGADFASKVVLATVEDATEYTISYQALNFKILDMLKAAEKSVGATDLEFRVLASSADPATSAAYSNVIATTITPFEGEKEFPSIAIRGAYTGWGFAEAQKIYSANSDNIYNGLIYFDGKAAEGWKLCGDESWTVNWGQPAEATAEQTPIVLVAGADNFNIYSKNFYNFEFDSESCEFKYYEAYDAWGVVGAHNNWGNPNEDESVTPDTPMTLGSEVNAAGATVYFLTATVDLAEKGEWKLRPDAQWASGARGAGSFAGGEPESIEGGNFIAPEAGNYTIKWYFNKVEQVLTLTKN